LGVFSITKFMPPKDDDVLQISVTEFWQAILHLEPKQLKIDARHRENPHARPSAIVQVI